MLTDTDELPLLPVPARLTWALDRLEDELDLHGPDVDAWFGLAEPAVDEWEAGTRVPSPDHLTMLALIAGCTVPYLFRPVTVRMGRMFVCDRSRRTRGLTIVEPDGTVVTC